MQISDTNLEIEIIESINVWFPVENLERQTILPRVQITKLKCQQDKRIDKFHVYGGDKLDTCKKTNRRGVRRERGHVPGAAPGGVIIVLQSTKDALVAHTCAEFEVVEPSVCLQLLNHPEHKKVRS